MVSSYDYCVRSFYGVLDSSLVNVAIPKLIAVFGSSTDTIEWVLNRVHACFSCRYSYEWFLGDKFGYKFMFVYALAAFTIGSLLCGVAWSDSSLILFRIVQGLGGGFIMPLSMALIYSIFPAKRLEQL